MPIENIDTLVVGAGQAGVAMSEHLSANEISHLVLERDRIAERWRTGRWDSLVANGPAWHDRFPGMEFSDIDPDAFVPKDNVADYFVEYANMIDAPIRTGVDVLNVQGIDGRTGFRVLTSEGSIEAGNVVVATGPFQKPIIPPVVPETEDLLQIHSNAYRNPDQLPKGAVMVVGAGSSGGQIADELLRSGRQVYLSIGPHDRPPRSYRGLDYVWWLGVLGKWDAVTPDPNTEHVTISVSGAHGGQTVDFRRFASNGMTLMGMTKSYKDGVFSFAPDLAENIERGDANYRSVLQEADSFADRNGLNLPEDPEAHILGPLPDCVTAPILELELESAGITSIVWATGYALDYDWLQVDAFTEQGLPDHQRGVSTEPGIYFLGLPWLSKRGSSFIYGVWDDAKYLSDHIAKQRNYMAHHHASRHKPTA